MATRTIANGGGNWNSTGTWVEGVVPVNGDAVVATGTSGQLTVNVVSACTSINFTNYVNTLTMNATLTVAGAVTFVAGMTIAGMSDLICTTTATLTSGGKTLTGGLQLQGTSQTFTLSGAWVVNGLLTFNGTTATTLNSSTLSVAGGITLTAATIGGTTAITMTGGTISGAGTLRTPLTLAGNVTFSGTINYNNTLTYSSGTITTTGSTLVVGANTIFNTNGVSWNNITFPGSATTITINSLLTVTGTLSPGNGAYTFAGTAGFTASAVVMGPITVSRTCTFKSGITYTASSSFAVTGSTSTVRMAFVASTPGTKAILTVNSGADMSLPYVDPTDIDSSGGIPVYTYKGTITTSSNWYAGSLTLPSASNVMVGSGNYGYSDAPIVPTGSQIIISRPRKVM